MTDLLRARTDPAWERIVALGVLDPVIRGGPAGRRQMMLIVYAVFLPASTVEVGLLGHWNGRLLALRVVLSLVIIGWLVWRRRPTAPEWLVVAVLLPLLGNAASQLTLGASLNTVLAVNIVAVLAAMALVFDGWLLATGVALSVAEFTAIQNHFHGDRVALLSGVLIGLAAVTVVVLVGTTARSLRKSYASLRASNMRSVQLHQQMATVAEDERRRIAGALHDDTVQVMTAAGLRVDRVRLLVESGDNEAALVAVREASLTIRSAVERTRQLSFDLYPPVLERLGLRMALEALAQQITAVDSLAVAVRAPEERPPVGVERLAYRTIKELLGNAHEHAAPSQIVVE
jgi:signal transduction histidine kinase